MNRTRPFLAATLAALLAVAAFSSFALAGDAATQATPTTKAAPAAKAAKPAHAMKSMPAVDLNTASREELVACPGIGEAIADKVIAARPFKMKSELLSKGLVGKAAYRKLAPHVIAKQR